MTALCNSIPIQEIKKTEFFRKLLVAVCNSYNVSMGLQEYERLNDEIKKHEESVTLSNWTADLIGRINRGIDSSIYQIISVPSDDEDFNSIDMQCLEDLIRSKAKPNDVVWIEDRKVNSYVQKDGAIIIGINEVLKALVATKKN